MKTTRLLTALSLSAGLLLSGTALEASAQQTAAAEEMHMDMSAAKADTPIHAGDPVSPSTLAFKHNAATMMKEMSAPGFTGDADADFVAHMIPHHQGAVEQAKVEIQYGADPKMKALAKSIIDAQDDEIAYMRQWQAEQNKNK